MKTCLCHCIIAGAIVVALESSAALAYAQVPIARPPVPSAIQVQEGNTAFLKSHAIGTQNYACVPSATGYIWRGAPQATLATKTFTPEQKESRSRGGTCTTAFAAECDERR